MKKKLLALAAVVLFLLPLANAQYFYNSYVNEGINPGGLNKDNEYPVGGGISTGWTTVLNSAPANPEYSSPIKLPFTFNFNGEDLDSIKIGTSGIVTFSINDPKIPTYSNHALPHANVPDKSICILGLSPVWASGAQFSKGITKTFGVTPNRQFWIAFNSYGAPSMGANGFTAWAIVLEETTNKIYIVDQRCSSPTTITISAGIQIDGSNATHINNTTSLRSNSISANPLPDDNSFYEFIQGTKPTNSARVKSIIFNEYNNNSDAPFTIKANIQNLGSENLSSIEASYKINDGSWITSNVNLPNILTNNSTQITHPTPFTPNELGAYTILFRVKKPNAGVDPFEDDDETSISIQVIDTFIVRRSLIESFSSSTCPPCRPGNIQLQSVTNQIPQNHYTYLKYQYNFPGTGDPYYTLEARDRGTFYGGVSSVPTTFIDGGAGFNPNSTTLVQVQGYQSVPSFVSIEASGFITWKDKINFDININPFIDLPAGIRLHVAIVERTTFKNIKNNGETEFHNVLKKFAYGAAGQSLPAIGKRTTHNVTGSYQVNGNYRLPANGQTANIINWNTEHSIENFHNLGLVIFLQNVQTKEILQSHLVDIEMNLSANQTELHKALIIYPNPANDYISVSFDKASQSDVIVRNIQGAIVSQTPFNFSGGNETYSLDTRNLANGVYTITVNSNGASVTKKIVISH